MVSETGFLSTALNVPEYRVCTAKELWDLLTCTAWGNVCEGGRRPPPNI